MGRRWKGREVGRGEAGGEPRDRRCVRHLGAGREGGGASLGCGRGDGEAGRALWGRRHLDITVTGSGGRGERV